jgi:integrase
VWAEIKNVEASNQGTEHSSFSTSLRLQAQTAANLLAPHDVSLLEAVKIALPIIESRTKSITVEDAIPRFFTDYRLHGGPKKAVVSASYLAYLQDMLGPFQRAYPQRLVCDVGVEEIERLLSGMKGAGAVTRQSYIRAISAFYGWCVRRGFRLDNPLSKLRKKLPKSEVTILSVANAQKLLDSAALEELPVLVLSLFCGIRIAEFRKITRDTRGGEHNTQLDWNNVDLKAKQVFIPPNLDKNQHGRYVDIPANALIAEDFLSN